MSDDLDARIAELTQWLSDTELPCCCGAVHVAAECERCRPWHTVEMVIARDAERGARVRLLEGAAAADEERLRAAAAKADVDWEDCDTPDALADAVLLWRQRVEKLEDEPA